MIRPATPARAFLALLPIRLFFGATFLYAGFDKLIDPSFLDPSAPTSLHAQLVAFARFSPLGGLIQAALPLSAEIGLLIAVAEIGIGIGALTGLAFRIAAAGGALLSLLFWLTASWATRPYYFGADLPYAVGWIALAMAGHGDLLVAARFRSEPSPSRPAGRARAGPRAELPPSPARRQLLQAGTLAAISAIAASVALPLRTLGLRPDAPSGVGLPEGTPLPTPGSGTPGPTIPGNGMAVARVADVQRTGSAAFRVPFDAPAPLPAGDPAVIVQLADGSFAAFDAVCTHAGCTVEWDQADRLLICPCHDAIFDPEQGAAVLDGPAPTPLTQLTLAVDGASGTILLVP